MISLRSFTPVLFASAVVLVASGCKDDPPPPTPDPLASAQSGAGIENKAGRPSVRGPASRFDPQTLKEYRVDMCYYGTLSFRQARDAYMASVGAEGPSAKKIPNFGIPADALPGAAGASRAPATPAAAKTPTPPPGSKAAGPSAAPKGSAHAIVPPGARDGRKPMSMPFRAPYERNARACAVAQALKEPAMPELDAAIAAFAPFALELSKNIAEAAAYYQRETYKDDKFEKGKEYHKKLVEGFGKLDELSDKLGVALAAWYKAHPPDASKMNEGQKAAFKAYEGAQKLLLGLLPEKIDAGAYKEGVAKLETDIEALKTFATGNPADIWSKGMLPALESFLRTAKEIEPKVTEAGLPSEMFGQMVNVFVALIENKQRTVSRALYNKNLGPPSRAPLPRPNVARPRESVK